MTVVVVTGATGAMANMLRVYLSQLLFGAYYKKNAQQQASWHPAIVKDNRQTASKKHSSSPHPPTKTIAATDDTHTLFTPQPDRVQIRPSLLCSRAKTTSVAVSPAFPAAILIPTARCEWPFFATMTVAFFNDSVLAQ